MRKSTLFVSAMLTVFLLATMFGVVSAYQQVVKNGDLTSNQQAQPPKVLSQPVKVELAPMPAQTDVVLPAPTVVTAEEATTIAIDFLGDPNVFSVEVVDYQGAPAYLVTFSSGDLVYVSSTGVVIANEKLQPVYVAANSSNNKKNNGGGSSDDGGNSGGGESHDDDDDHEEHDDHDD